MATNSIRSDALEPSRAELENASLPTRLIRLLPVYGLPILTILLIALFSIILPDTFPTMLNLRSIIADKAIIALLSLAAMIPMASGKIDLTVGYGIVLWHILAISLQTSYGIDWRVAVVRKSIRSSLRWGRVPCCTPSRCGIPAGVRSSARCPTRSPLFSRHHFSDYQSRQRT
jgi:predicted ABC-type sugar transport system permease subunit